MAHASPPSGKHKVFANFTFFTHIAPCSIPNRHVNTGGVGGATPPILYPVGKSEGSWKIQGCSEKAISIRKCLFIPKN